MTTTWILRGLSALLLALACAAHANSPCAKKMRWADDAPYSMRLPDGRISGVRVELAQLALSRMGCSLVLVEMPFARALLELKDGRLDMLGGAFPRPERRVYAHFSKPEFSSPNLVFVRGADRARMAGKGLVQLVAEGWRLGVQPGVAYGPAYEDLQQQAVPSSQITTVARRASLWQMLVRERIDLVIADQLTARYELAHADLVDQVVASALVISDEPTGMAFSKLTTDEAFVHRYNETMDGLRDELAYRTIMERYGLSRSAAVKRGKASPLP
ncbi:substrate-binding periplasmic protein [Inhella sp.]|uniref:substrate-binding periplasmic protein n=1 Tax=Inhella sp. TaxID=1921806 RepID=UPI0035AF14DE